MEVETGYIWKVTSIGGTHFFTSMFIGGRVNDELPVIQAVTQVTFTTFERIT